MEINGIVKSCHATPYRIGSVVQPQDAGPVRSTEKPKGRVPTQQSAELSKLELGGGPETPGIHKAKLGISLLPLELANATDTLDVRPEDYRIPDTYFCGKVCRLSPSTRVMQQRRSDCSNVMHMGNYLQVLRAEPDVRVPETVEGPSCSCGDKCDDLDFPRVSYLLNGFDSKDDLRKDVKPDERDVKPLMLDSFFLERNGQPFEEHTAGLARMANAPTIMHIGVGVAEQSELPPVRNRKQVASLSGPYKTCSMDASININAVQLY
eukprot:scaffold11301_cov29-Prasinocladus_malaysianus.AAC.2